jgi:hypothetical protein
MSASLVLKTQAAEGIGAQRVRVQWKFALWEFSHACAQPGVTRGHLF